MTTTRCCASRRAGCAAPTTSSTRGSAPRVRVRARPRDRRCARAASATGASRAVGCRCRRPGRGRGVPACGECGPCAPLVSTALRTARPARHVRVHPGRRAPRACGAATREYQYLGPDAIVLPRARRARPGGRHAVQPARRRRPLGRHAARHRSGRRRRGARAGRAGAVGGRGGEGGRRRVRDGHRSRANATRSAPRGRRPGLRRRPRRRRRPHTIRCERFATRPVGLPTSWSTSRPRRPTAFGQAIAPGAPRRHGRRRRDPGRCGCASSRPTRSSCKELRIVGALGVDSAAYRAAFALLASGPLPVRRSAADASPRLDDAEHADADDGRRDVTSRRRCTACSALVSSARPRPARRTRRTGAAGPGRSAAVSSGCHCAPTTHASPVELDALDRRRRRPRPRPRSPSPSLLDRLVVVGRARRRASTPIAAASRDPACDPTSCIDRAARDPRACRGDTSPVGDVLVERAAERDVEHLVAAADRERRHGRARPRRVPAASSKPSRCGDDAVHLLVRAPGRSVSGSRSPPPRSSSPSKRSSSSSASASSSSTGMSTASCAPARRSASRYGVGRGHRGVDPALRPGPRLHRVRRHRDERRRARHSIRIARSCGGAPSR